MNKNQMTPTDNKAPIEYQLCKLHYGGGTVEHWFVEKKAYDKLQAELEELKIRDRNYRTGSEAHLKLLRNRLERAESLLRETQKEVKNCFEDRHYYGSFPRHSVLEKQINQYLAEVEGE